SNVADVLLNFALPTDLPARLPVMALRRGILLPGTVAPFVVGRERSLSAVNAAPDGFVLVAAQREAINEPTPADLLPTATLAKIIDRTRIRGNADRVVVQGMARVSLGAFPLTHPHLEAVYSLLDDTWPDTAEADGVADAFRSAVAESAEGLPNGEAAVQALLKLPFSLMIDAVAGMVGAPEDWLREIQLTHDPVARAERVLERLIRAREATAAQKSIRERVENSTRDQQREYFLRQQLNAIRQELGEQGDASDDLVRLREKLLAKQLPEEARGVVDRELARLERLNGQSPERSVAVDWLEWIADLPWGVQSAVDVDLTGLEDALDASHHGLDDVKKQVVEHLAVRKLQGSGRAEVMLLVGPPGVGKTSIGQAIAEATGRKLVRVALGGVRDESELRGHRRTYIGSRPGRLVEGIRRAGTADPVVLLDEIDKLGTGHWGDPASALLEILDPEQNHAFVDRYLEVAFDLSKVLFVATANDLGSIPGPLRDRMQVIEIAGYARDEKLRIARDHLLPTVAKNAGMEKDDVVFTDDAIKAAIAGYTRESGVRELQRVLGKVYRAAAVAKARTGHTDPLEVDETDLVKYLGRARFTEDAHEVVSQPGIATGLAWTPVGGDILYIEAITFPGNGNLILTGQLGDVMKESARAALTYTLANAAEIGIPADCLKGKDLHVHVPAGSVPKDGPSAGVTMFTAIASLLSGRPVCDDTAMTGEATLRGRVLPVGGIKSKILAAHRLGARRVILPRKNEVDLDDVPADVRKEMEFLLVDSMDEVLAAALRPARDRQAGQEGTAVVA
ncbi:MAG: endopeptidase La, partial [Deltaproteobacteria bacterium]|nr:endopeptidase La [Deltaproteobacteria bacterium]